MGTATRGCDYGVRRDRQTTRLGHSQQDVVTPSVSWQQGLAVAYTGPGLSGKPARWYDRVVPRSSGYIIPGTRRRRPGTAVGARRRRRSCERRYGGSTGVIACVDAVRPPGEDSGAKQSSYSSRSQAAEGTDPSSALGRAGDGELGVSGPNPTTRPSKCLSTPGAIGSDVDDLDSHRLLAVAVVRSRSGRLIVSPTATM